MLISSLVGGVLRIELSSSKQDLFVHMELEKNKMEECEIMGLMSIRNLNLEV